MAVPHYAYLKMKMSGTKGIITIAGDYKKSAACAAASSRLVESLVIAAEKKLLDRVVAMAGKQLDLSPDPKESETQGSFRLAKETKKIPLDPDHPERHAIVGPTLIENRKASSSISSVTIGTSSHGLPKTGRVFRRISPSPSYMSDHMQNQPSNPCAACQRKREELLVKR